MSGFFLLKIITFRTVFLHLSLGTVSSFNNQLLSSACLPSCLSIPTIEMVVSVLVTIKADENYNSYVQCGIVILVSCLHIARIKRSLEPDGW